MPAISKSPHDGVRNLALALLVICFSGCDSAERLSPPTEIPTTVATPDLYTGATAPGIAFASFDMDNALLGSVHTGAVRATDPATLLSLLAGARAKGARLVISMHGNDKYSKNADGTFSLSKWKSMVDRFKSVNINSYITDGTILGHYLLDEPDLASKWAGHVVPQATVEAMAKYSKLLWPKMTTFIRANPRWLAGSTITYVYLDAAWSQYISTDGSSPSSWVGKQVTAAKTKHLGLIVGLNVLDGGNGTSGIKGTYGTKWAMSASELRTYGTAMLAQSYACGFAMWKYSSAYYSRSDVKSALATLATQAKNHTKTSCRQ